MTRWSNEGLDDFPPHEPARRASARLVGFLYILMRDELPTGKVAGILKEHCQHDVDAVVKYSNKHLEAYARELAAYLTPAPRGQWRCSCGVRELDEPVGVLVCGVCNESLVRCPAGQSSNGGLLAT